MSNFANKKIWQSDTWYRLKQNSCWQRLTISILFVLNSFMKVEDICNLFNGISLSP